MPNKKKQCVTPVCTRASNTTVGILSALGITGAFAACALIAKNAATQVCQKTSSSLGSAISNFMSSNISTPPLTFNATISFPSEIPINAIITTPYGDIPINQTIPFKLPDQIPVNIPSINSTGEEAFRRLFGQGFDNSVLSVSSTADQDCITYTSIAIFISAGILAMLSVFLIAVLYGYGSRLCEHETRLNELENDIESARPGL